MTANRPYDDDDLPPRGYVERRADPNRADREISLGTPTILGIFFVLALAFAAVFGVGYTMGHHSASPAIAAVDPATGLPVSSIPKPNAGSFTTHHTPTQVSADASPAAQVALPLDSPAHPSVSTNSASTPKPADAAIVGDKILAAPPQPATSNQPPATSFMVQVAAVSSQDVADILLASLQKKGYSVAVHHEPQDKLLHVQIGPFADKKEAEAMRQRVLADGFNAIVK
jgi:DedD protein